MSSADNPVVQALRSFPANSVYFLASKNEVLKGFRYHEEQRVESYFWSKDRGCLETKLRVDGLTTVSFSMEDGKLSFACDCNEWRPESHCAHVIGGLLTTINLLTPHLFQRRREDSHYLDALKRDTRGAHDSTSGACP